VITKLADRHPMFPVALAPNIKYNKTDELSIHKVWVDNMHNDYLEF